MDGIRNLFGDRKAYVRIGGKAYALNTMKLDDFAEREDYILALRNNSFKALDKLPANTSDEVRKHVAELAFREHRRGNYVTVEEELEFKRSMHGRIYDFWKSLQPNHPEFDTFQKAADLMEQGLREGNEEELAAAVASTREDDILGNSSAPMTTPTQTMSPESDPAVVGASTDGPACTEASSSISESTPSPPAS